MSFELVSPTNSDYKGCAVIKGGINLSKHVNMFFKKHNWKTCSVYIDLETKQIKIVKDGEHTIQWYKPIYAKVARRGMPYGRYSLTDESSKELLFTYEK